MRRAQQSMRSRSRRGLPPALRLVRKRRIRAWTLAGAGTISAALIFAFFAEQLAYPRIDSNDTTQIELGKHVYAEACASCHGASLEGQPNWPKRLPSGRLPAPPLNASGNAWRHTDRMLFAITKNGPIAYAAGEASEHQPPQRLLQAARRLGVETTSVSTPAHNGCRTM